MSLSKNIQKCNRCACLVTRHRQFNSESANPDKIRDGPVKMPGGSQLKIMSISHWKLLNHLKDYINKTSNNKAAFVALQKEWTSLLQKVSLIYKEIEQTNQKNSSSSTPANDVLPKELPPEKIPETPVSTTATTVTSVSPSIIPDNVPKELHSKEGYNFPQVFSELKKRISSKSSGDEQIETTPKWKPKKDVISKLSISSRTKHIIASIAHAGSDSSRLKRLEDLLDHLKQYPDARHFSVEEGGICLLLRLRRSTTDEPTLGVIRQGLAMLGHVDPLPGQGIRILSIDGGGVRGIIAIEILKKLEELTGKRVFELFDYICGVSTGALLVGIIGAQKTPLDEVSRLYKEMSKKVFNQSAFWGTSNLVWSHSYYSTEIWEQMLKTYVGDVEMITTTRDAICPKMAAVSAVVNQPKVMAFVFRNYMLPQKMPSQYVGSIKYRIWEAARASAAAPAYFEEFKLDEYLHQDGGILVNNPCAVAIHEAKHLWPGYPLQCVVSLGTGRTGPFMKDVSEATKNLGNSSSLKTKFMKILDSATDTEGVHTILNDLLPVDVYYRFNPYLTEMVSMDDSRSEKISQLEMDSEMYFRRNEDAFKNAAKMLVKSQTITQRCHNWITLTRKLMGVK